MKPITSIWILILFASCATNTVVQNYLENEIKIDRFQDADILLIREKVPVLHTIRTLKGLGIRQNDNSVIYSGSKLFTTADFKYLEGKNIEDSIQEIWSYKDFKSLKLKIVSAQNDGIHKYLDSLSKFPHKPITYVYYFSKPIIFKNKKLILFYAGKSIGRYSGQAIYSQVIVVKRQMGRWRIVEKVESTDIN